MFNQRKCQKLNRSVNLRVNKLEKVLVFSVIFDFSDPNFKFAFSER